MNDKMQLKVLYEKILQTKKWYYFIGLIFITTPLNLKFLNPLKKYSIPIRLLPALICVLASMPKIVPFIVYKNFGIIYKGLFTVLALSTMISVLKTLTTSYEKPVEKLLTILAEADLNFYSLKISFKQGFYIATRRANLFLLGKIILAVLLRLSCLDNFVTLNRDSYAVFLMAVCMFCKTYITNFIVLHLWDIQSRFNKINETILSMSCGTDNYIYLGKCF